jgi:glycosyltransferase involved in cell wall biosynthesis
MYMPEYEKFPHKLYLTKSTEFVARHADHLVAVSEFTKQSLLQHNWGAQSERITVIPEGVDQEHFYPRGIEEVGRVRKRYSIHGDYLFFVSTIQPRKNVIGLLEAYAQARSSFTTNPTLVLAGKPGWKFEEVKEAIDRLHLQSAVTYLGRVPDEDLPGLFSGAEVFVYPSFVEGFGLPVLEAMACGTPVLASQSGAIPEVGADAALYFDPKRVEHMAQQMVRLVQDKSLAQELIKKGYERVRHYTWEKTAQNLILLWEKLLGEE